MTKLRGLVIYTHNLERLKAFYAAIGLEMWEEQHGNGPRHCSSILEDAVLEIYPAFSDDQLGKIRLEFSVDELLDKVEDAVKYGGQIRRGPSLNNNVYTVTLEDPDGNTVVLTQGKTYINQR